MAGLYAHAYHGQHAGLHNNPAQVPNPHPGDDPKVPKGWYQVLVLLRGLLLGSFRFQGSFLGLVPRFKALLRGR